MARYGSYPQYVIDQVSEILSEHSIPFQIEKTKPTKTKSPGIKRGYRGPPNVGYIVIAEEDLDRIPVQLEKYGIIPPMEIEDLDDSSQFHLSSSKRKERRAKFALFSLFVLLLIYVLGKMHSRR